MSRQFAEPLARLLVAAAAGALAAGGSPPAGTAAVTVTLDAQRTTISWSLSTFPDVVHGTFRLERGAVRFDPESGDADGCHSVDTRSGESGNRSRDRKMHDQVLESAHHPDATLRPTSVEGRLPAEGEGVLHVQGRLSLHGAEHPVTLPVRVARHGAAVTADTALAIPYVAWGLADPSVFVFRASKTVDLALHAVGTIAPDPSPPVACGP
jgi:polyisoprenoid-binding protein YceI